ncbi:hypothetical protein Bca4012_071246 [Brassica carinata]
MFLVSASVPARVPDQLQPEAFLILTQTFATESSSSTRPLLRSRQHQTARVRRSWRSRSSNKGRLRPDRSDSIHSS